MLSLSPGRNAVTLHNSVRWIQLSLLHRCESQGVWRLQESKKAARDLLWVSKDVSPAEWLGKHSRTVTQHGRVQCASGR